MKIVNVSPFQVEIITIEDKKEEVYYYRWGKFSWDIRYGESLEPVWDCDKLEKLYQEYKKEKENEESI